MGEPGFGGYDRHLHPVADGGRAARPQVDRVSSPTYETVETDVLVLGAGGAGLRGAIGAAESGARVLGGWPSRRGTGAPVWAEDVVAADGGNVACRDAWEVGGA